MIKSKQILTAAVIALSFFFVACGSTPEEKTPDAAAVEEAVNDAVDETEGASNTAKTPEEIEKENNELLKLAEEARKDALDAGAKDANSFAWEIAEKEYAAAKETVEASKTVDHSRLLKDVINRYNALKAYADAKKAKERVDELNFASYDQKNYNEGCALIDELAKPESNAVLGAEWGKKSNAALECMNSVLNAGFKELAKAERTEAFKAKKNADSVKCAVSRKSDYDKYVENFKNGDQNYVTKNPEGALANYKKAKEGFTVLYSEVSEARAKAQKAIDEAKKRVADSEGTAQWADKEKPLGDEKIEGIEAEDAVLLEEDDFSESEANEVEVSEEIQEAE